MTTLFIAGATGLVGNEALKLALADPRIDRVVAPTRRAIAPHERLVNPRFDAFIADAGDALWHADGAICALGTTRAAAGSAAAFRAVDHDLVLLLARRLREAGTENFALVSALGADPRSRLLYPRTKGEVEDAIRALAFPSLTIFRPGFLDGDREENRPMEKIFRVALRIGAPLLPKSARASSVPKLAAMLVAAALSDQRGTRIVPAAQLAA